MAIAAPWGRNLLPGEDRFRALGSPKYCSFYTQPATARSCNEFSQTTQTSMVLLRLLLKTMSQEMGRSTSHSLLLSHPLLWQHLRSVGQTQASTARSHLSLNHGYPRRQQLLLKASILNTKNGQFMPILQLQSSKFRSCQPSVLHSDWPGSSSETSLSPGHGLCQEGSPTSLTSFLVGQGPSEMFALRAQITTTTASQAWE